MNMRVSSFYIDGIREGRSLLNSWKRDGFDVQALLASDIESITRLRDKLARCAYTEHKIEFLDGQLDFFRNQTRGE
jgi:hypothetical protein